MKISEMNWGQVEAYLRKDDRAILPLGCTEHCKLAQPLSRFHPGGEAFPCDAAEPLGVPVFPVVRLWHYSPIS